MTRGEHDAIHRLHAPDEFGCFRDSLFLGAHHADRRWSGGHLGFGDGRAQQHTTAASSAGRRRRIIGRPSG